MAARLQCSGEYDIFLKLSLSALDQWWTLRTLVMSLCRLCPHSSHPSNQQNGTSARLLTSPFHGGANSRGQIQELRVLMSPQMLHGKTHCLSMQPPASEQRSALCKAQSLGSSLIHTIPAAHQWLPGLEDTALLFTRLFIRYQPPNSGLPCVEDTLSFTWYQPHVSSCHV